MNASKSNTTGATPPAPVDVDTTTLPSGNTSVVSADLQSDVAAEAARYAREHGFAVFPCRPGGKEPAVAGGFKAATSDPVRIESLFAPDHNLAIRTGSASDLLVLDVDVPGGEETLAALEAEHEELPETVAATTPRGGRHYYFRMPEGVEVKCSASKIGEKLDIRAEDGYVLAPPGRVGDGSYQWVAERSPDEVVIAPAPQWLVDLAASARSVGPVAGPQPHAGSIGEGTRNETLAKLAGAMRRVGMTKEGIKAGLLQENATRCEPPLQPAEVTRIAESIAKYEPADPLGSDGAGFEPIPVQVLPDPLRGFIENGSATIGCDPSYLVLPLLSGLASAIGNTRVIELKQGWLEPAILWTAIVGDSGTMKSPALEMALRPVRQRQRRDFDLHALAVAEHEEAMARHEKAIAAWRNSGGDPPVGPVKPVARRSWADDLTIEALALLLQEQPRGMLVACDELASWLGGFDRYSQSSGGDAARWLEMHGGRSMTVDRKTGEPRTIFVPRASVSVAGGIQPGSLGRALTPQHRESGLAARLLLACPPRRAKVWSEAQADEKLAQEVAGVFDRLYGLQGTGEGGVIDPVAVQLSPAAKRKWIDFYNDHARETSLESGDLAAAFSKLEGAAARIALVLHEAQQARARGSTQHAKLALSRRRQRSRRAPRFSRPTAYVRRLAGDGWGAREGRSDGHATLIDHADYGHLRPSVSWPGG